MNGLTRRGAICCLGCFTAFGFRAEASSNKRPDFEFREIAPGVFRHTSWNTLPNGAYFPSNGMVVVGRDRTLMVDTAWTPDQTELLLGLMSPFVGARPVDLFITHFHDDRLGGIGVTARRGIVSHAFERTVHEAARAKAGDIARAFGPVSHTFDLGRRKVEAFYPGAGHTVDNAVVYDARSRVLFGGCMIRAAAATDMGNTADAVMRDWATSVARTAERFPKTRVVVPGHGKVGDRGLLAHTIALARAVR